MTDAATTIERAAHWADFLVRREKERKGFETVQDAMEHLASRLRVSSAVLWSLAYRKPKRIWADTYLTLHAAYVAECERQMRHLHHELEITKALAGPDCRAVRAASALVPADQE